MYIAWVPAAPMKWKKMQMWMISENQDTWIMALNINEWVTWGTCIYNFGAK